MSMRLAARKDRLKMEIAAKEEELFLLNAFGEDDFNDGDVIMWDRRFSPYPSGKLYKYVALKAAGQWYLTSRLQPSPITWDRLVDQIAEAEGPIYRVTAWEQIYTEATRYGND
jgi:hypothetical protein